MAADTPPPAGSSEQTAARCANCGIPIAHEPTVKGERAYCCDGCGEGGPCLC